MPRFLIQIVVNLLTATIALMVAGAVIDGVTVRPAGIITAVAVFVIANALFAPFAFKMARKYAPAAIGGIGLISTLIALMRDQSAQLREFGVEAASLNSATEPDERRRIAR